MSCNNVCSTHTWCVHRVREQLRTMHSTHWTQVGHVHMNECHECRVHRITIVSITLFFLRIYTIFLTEAGSEQLRDSSFYYFHC